MHPTFDNVLLDDSTPDTEPSVRDTLVDLEPYGAWAVTTEDAEREMETCRCLDLPAID